MTSPRLVRRGRTKKSWLMYWRHKLLSLLYHALPFLAQMFEDIVSSSGTCSTWKDTPSGCETPFHRCSCGQHNHSVLNIVAVPEVPHSTSADKNRFFSINYYRAHVWGSVAVALKSLKIETEYKNRGFEPNTAYPYLIKSISISIYLYICMCLGQVHNKHRYLQIFSV